MIKIPSTVGLGENNISGNEDLVNLYPVPCNNLTTPYILRSRSGMDVYRAGIEGKPLSMVNVGNFSYIITTTKLLGLDVAGNLKEIGDIDMDSDDYDRFKPSVATSLNEVVCVNGISNFVYKIKEDELTTIQEINPDIDFKKCSSVVYVNKRFVFNQRDSSEFIWTDIDSLQLNGEYATTQKDADINTSMQSIKNSLVIFGEKSIERWVKGNDIFNFISDGSISYNLGCISPSTVCKIKNNLYFVGNDDIIYTMGADLQPRRISNSWIEKVVSSSIKESLSSYCYSYQGRIFYVLQIVQKNLTFVYDVTTGQWHRRVSGSNGNKYYDGFFSFNVRGRVLVLSRSQNKIFVLNDKPKDVNDSIFKSLTLPKNVYRKAKGKVFSIKNLLMEVNLGFSEEPLEFNLKLGTKKSKVVFGAETGYHTNNLNFNNIGTVSNEQDITISTYGNQSLEIGGIYIEV